MTYAIDINLEAILVLGDATGEARYVEFVAGILAARHQGDPLVVPRWQANPFNFVTFDYWLRRPDPRFVAPFVAQVRQKWREENYSPEGALAHRGKPGETPLLLDALQEHISRLARAGRLGGDSSFYEEAAHQWTLYRRLLRNSQTGLWAHGRGYHGAPMELTPWAWGRGHGWLLRGLVEALTVLPADASAGKTLKAGLAELASTLLQYQDESGMWHQIVDRRDSYSETSGTAIISYYLARAVVQGLLPAESYSAASRRAFAALGREFVTAEGEVHGICRGTGPQATLQDYLDREQVVDDLHGTAFVVMAAAGQIFLDQNRSVPPIPAKVSSSHLSQGSGNRLSWASAPSSFTAP